MVNPMSDVEGKIDQFESVFRSADKPLFHLREIELRRIVTISDHSADEADRFEQSARSFLARSPDQQDTQSWTQLNQTDFTSFDSWQDRIDTLSPDLVITARNQFDPIQRGVHSLGFFVDELTQRLLAPVLLMPDSTQEEQGASAILPPPQDVLVLTNHLTGEDRLVSIGVFSTPDSGKLILGHLEEEDTFERYMHAIERIAEINSEDAKRLIREQLLKEPRDYAESCIRATSESRPGLSIEAHVAFGAQMSDYKHLIATHEVDLIVMYTKDESQMAMHGMAYSLAVEFRDIPILML